MNIGMICYPTYGGSGVVATELGIALAQRGHQVHFISYAMPFRLSAGFYENVYYHEVTTTDYPLFEHPLYTDSLAARAADLAETEDLDILHAHYAIPHATAAFLAREMSRNRRLRIVTTMHGTDVTLVGRSETFAPLVTLSLRKSDRVTVVSDWLREMSLRHFAVDRHIDVIHNFVDAERFKRLPGACPCERSLSGKDRVLLHISNFRPVKRVEDVIRTFERIQRDVPSMLFMIGDGPDREKAVRLARELGVCSKVRFLGKQNGIENFLGHADLFFMPSDHESFGLAALEAMACETPVIASRSGGLCEVIEDGVTGALEAVGDVEAMAARAVEILQRPPLHQRMAKAARQRAIERFSIDKIVSQYERLYAETIDSPPWQEIPAAELVPNGNRADEGSD